MVSSAAQASEPDLFGLGARSSALGATGAADARGYEATYLNPAGLVDRSRRARPRLTVGYLLARQRLRLDGVAHPVEPTSGVLIGADLPIPFGGVLRDRVALGLAFYFPTNFIVRAQAPYPDEPRLALLEERTQVVSLLVAAGFRILPQLSIGVGVLALAALIGEIDITTVAGGRVTTTSEQQLITHFAPVVGVRARPLDWLRVGVALRGESLSRYDLAIKSRLGALIPLSLPVVRVAGVAQYDPLQLSMEGAARYRFFTGVTGVTWKHWSAFPLPTENATPGAPTQPNPGYHDTAVPRVAVEADRTVGPIRLSGRLGYYFEWSPAPREAPTLVDADRHVLTCGIGIGWRSRLTALVLDAFGQWHRLAPHPRAAGDLGVFGVTLGVDL
jgi:long-chain fatty acid transport protein